MKLKLLHSKKNFLKFLSLSILVLAGSVGVILATQKQVFDEPEAMGGGMSCNLSGSCNADKLGSEMCGANNWKYTCVYRYGRYFFTKSYNCESIGKKCSGLRESNKCVAKCTDIGGGGGNCGINGDTRCYGTELQQCVSGFWTTYKNCNTWGQVCAIGKGNVAYCGAIPSTPKPNPTSTPISTWCQYDCATRYECRTEGGTQKTGRCDAGEVCCKF